MATLKLKSRKESSLLGHTVILLETDDKKFQVEASQYGISFRGESPLIETRRELDEFAQVVASAWKAHLTLKPRIEVVKSL